MATAKEILKTEVNQEIFCDPCKNNDEHEVAVSYCEYCNEYLCQNCHYVHKRLKATKNHLIKQQDELPLKRTNETTETDQPEKCLTHGNQVIDQYCVSHKDLCCSQCLATIHKTCTDVRNITDYLDTLDFQQEENEIERKMRCLSDEVNKTMYRINASLKVVEHYHSKAQSELLKAKHSAIDHIESLHKEVAVESNKLRDANLGKIMPYKQKCDAVAFDLKTFNLYLSEKKKSSRKKMFFAMKNIEAKMTSNFKDLTDIKFIEHFNVNRYQFKPSDGIGDLNSSSFGSMKEKTDVMKTATKIKSLQINDDNDEEDCCITGLALLSETRLVLVDKSNSKVKLVDTEEDKIISKLDFDSAPWDVTYVPNNKIAVTFPEENKIEILSIINNSTFEKAAEREITCSGKSYGITGFKDTIIVAVRLNEGTTKIERYGLDGTLQLSVDVDIVNPRYVVCYEDETKIYVSDDTGGNRIVELSSNDLTTIGKLSSCRDEVTGMAIDKTGILYYCDSYYHEIDVAYLNKMEVSEIRQQGLISDKSPSPKCLVFCNETSRLFVGLNGNEISIYEVL